MPASMVVQGQSIVHTMIVGIYSTVLSASVTFGSLLKSKAVCSRLKVM